MDTDALSKHYDKQVKDLEARLLAALGKGGKAGGKGGGGAGGGTPRGGAGGGGKPTKKKLQPRESTEKEKQLDCNTCGGHGRSTRTCFQTHPHLKELRAKAAEAKKAQKRLAAPTDAPRGADGALLVDAVTTAAAEKAGENSSDEDDLSCPALAAAEAEPELYSSPPPSTTALCAALPNSSSSQDRPLLAAADVLAAAKEAAEEEARLLTPYLLGAALENPADEQRVVDTLKKVVFGSKEKRFYSPQDSPQDSRPKRLSLGTAPGSSKPGKSCLAAAKK